MLVLLRIESYFSLCAQSWFTAKLQTYSYSNSFSALQNSNLLLTWVLQSHVRWGFVYIIFSSWSGSTKSPPVDQRLFNNVYSTVSSPPSGGYFAISLLPRLFLLLSFGVCLGCSSFWPSFIRAATHAYEVPDTGRHTCVYDLCFPWTSKLWNALPLSIFPPTYSRSIFKRRTNKLFITWMLLHFALLQHLLIMLFSLNTAL